MKLFKTVNDMNAVKIQNDSLSKSILIVDDSRFSRNILRDIIKSEGYFNIMEAGDGLEAIEMAKQNSPEYIFMDVAMPKLDGLGAIPKILEIEPNAHIIMCTAMGQKSIIVEALKIGAIDYVIKPYKKENIVGVMNTHMYSSQKDGNVIPFKAVEKHSIPEKEPEEIVEEETSEELVEVEKLEISLAKEILVALVEDGKQENVLAEETFETHVEMEKLEATLESMKEEEPQGKLVEETMVALLGEEHGNALVEETLETIVNEEELENTFVKETLIALVDEKETVTALEEETLQVLVKEEKVKTTLEEETLQVLVNKEKLENTLQEGTLQISVEEEKMKTTLEEGTLQVLVEEEKIKTALEEGTLQAFVEEEKIKTALEKETLQAVVEVEKIKTALEEESLQAGVDKEEIETALEEETLQAVVGKEEIETALEDKALQAVVGKVEIKTSFEDKALQALVDKGKIKVALEEEALHILAEEEEIETTSEEEIVGTLVEEKVRETTIEVPEVISNITQFTYLWKNRFDSMEEDASNNKLRSETKASCERMSFLDFVNLQHDKFDCREENNSEREIMLGMISAYMCLDNRLQNDDILFGKRLFAYAGGIKIFTNNIVTKELNDRNEITMSVILDRFSNKAQTTFKVHPNKTSLSNAVLHLVQGKANRFFGQE